MPVVLPRYVQMALDRVDVLSYYKSPLKSHEIQLCVMMSYENQALLI